MTRSEKQAYLAEEIEDWHKRLERALLNVVNNKRKARNTTLYPRDTPVYIPNGPNANLFLLTLKVWCIKHHVTPEWLIEQLIFRFKHLRKPDEDPDQINLQLPAPMLVGTVARNFIEEALKLSFPNNENKKSQSIPIPREIQVDYLDFSLPETVDQYTDAIIKERESFEKKIKPKHWKRPFRQI